MLGFPGPAQPSPTLGDDRLRAAGVSVPVVYTTANENPAVRVTALQSGCVAYLTKPFSGDGAIEKASAMLT